MYKAQCIARCRRLMLLRRKPASLPLSVSTFAPSCPDFARAPPPLVCRLQRERSLRSRRYRSPTLHLCSCSKICDRLSAHYARFCRPFIDRGCTGCCLQRFLHWLMVVVKVDRSINLFLISGGSIIDMIFLIKRCGI